MIPTVEAEEFHSSVIRELTEHYQASIDSQSCEELLELTMSIYSKKRTLEQQKKKFGVIDERYMKRGEELLFGELAAALEIPREQVPEYIESRVEKLKR
jgi:CarD family transcriptional regulator